MAMDLGLSGSVAVVTGASRGIGLAVVRGLAANDVRVIAGAKPEDVVSRSARQMVTGRFTQPGEVADQVLFLASDRAANITGADITIDGGMTPTW